MYKEKILLAYMRYRIYMINLYDYIVYKLNVHLLKYFLVYDSELKNTFVCHYRNWRLSCDLFVCMIQRTRDTVRNPALGCSRSKASHVISR